ncbi:MAG TPA: addiction module protein [Thermoanaerobaculia bacterium]|nr:addiction module protein [Thermoanaerobaculia bacterium]
MATTIAELEAEALALDLDERAALAARLLRSLDQPTPAENERLWLDEAERRLKDFERGEPRMLDGPQALREILDELD